MEQLLEFFSLILYKLPPFTNYDSSLFIAVNNELVRDTYTTHNPFIITAVAEEFTASSNACEKLKHNHYFSQIVSSNHFQPIFVHHFFSMWRVFQYLTSKGPPILRRSNLNKGLVHSPVHSFRIVLAKFHMRRTDTRSQRQLHFD